MYRSRHSSPKKRSKSSAKAKTTSDEAEPTVTATATTATINTVPAVPALPLIEEEPLPPPAAAVDDDEPQGGIEEEAAEEVAQMEDTNAESAAVEEDARPALSAVNTTTTAKAVPAPPQSSASFDAASPSTPSQPSVAEDITRLKQRFTAPFMVYDVVAKSIVANPLYDRVTASELARVQGTVLSVLRRAQHGSDTLTPKELLFSLERAVLYVFASTAVKDNTQALRCVVDDVEAARELPQLEGMFAARTATAKAIAAVGYALTEGVSASTIRQFVSQLQDRLSHEMEPAMDKHRSKSERHAIQSTRNNLDDFARLYDCIVVAFQGIQTDSQRQRQQPLGAAAGSDQPRLPSDAANATTAGLLEQEYYNLLRWLIAVDQDRQALQRAAAPHTPREVGPAGEVAPAATTENTVEAYVAEYDPYGGRIVLQRSSPSSRWGLVINSSGYLVSIDNALRNASEPGAKLFESLQQPPQQLPSATGRRKADAATAGAAAAAAATNGTPVLQINRRTIRPANLSDAELQEQQSTILKRIRECLMGDDKTLTLLVAKKSHAELTVPRQVLFESFAQGDEFGAGQQVLLVLQRASTSIPWGLQLATRKHGPPVLKDFSAKMVLSDRAKNFLYERRGHLQVLHLNYADAKRYKTASSLMEACAKSLLLSVQLQVAPSWKGQAAAAATTDLTTEEAQTVSTEAPAAEAQMEHGVTAAGEPAEAGVAGTTKVGGANLQEVSEAIADAYMTSETNGSGSGASAEEEAKEAEEEEGDPVPAEDETAAEAEAEAELNEEAAADDDGSEELPEEEEIEAEGEVAPAAEADDVLEGMSWAKPTAVDGEEEDDPEHARLSEEAAHRALLEEYAIHPDDPLPETDATTEVDAGKSDNAEAVEEGKEEEDAAEAVDSAVQALMARTAAEGAALSSTAAAEREKEAAELEEKASSSSLSKRKKKKALATEGTDGGNMVGEGKSVAGTKTVKKLSKKKKGKLMKKKKAGGGKGKKGTANVSAAAEEEGEADDTAAVGDNEGEPATVDEDAADAQQATATVSAAEADVPLVESKTSAEVAMETAEKATKGKKRGRKAKATEEIEATPASAETDEGAGEAAKGEPAADTASGKEKGKRGRPKRVASGWEESGAEAAAPASARPAEDRVSISELVEAPPLTFDNHVTLDSFDGTNLQLHRQNEQSPWDIKVAFAGDDILMTKLPPFPKSSLSHPFLKSLNTNANGEVKWVVEAVNGRDISQLGKVAKKQALEGIKRSTNLSFALRALKR